MYLKPKKINKPFWQEKEGNLHIASFKNKNSKGKEYIKSTITARTYPFTFNQTLHLSEPELLKLIKLLNKKPQFVPKEKKPRKKKNEE